jgi:hypothetical protein
MSEEEFDPEYDVDISGLERWEVLMVLHANTRAIGLGVLNDKELTEDEAKALVADREYFDYVHGRPLKIGFHHTWITGVKNYDRDSVRPAHVVIALLRLLREAEFTNKLMT